MDSVYLADWNNSIILAEDGPHPERHPENSVLSPELVELVVNICDELSLTSEVEFTCLDNFDVYVRHKYSQILHLVAQAGDGNCSRASGSRGTTHNVRHNNSNGNSSQQSFMMVPDRTMDETCQMEMGQFAYDTPVRLVAVLMLSAKMIGNGTVRQMRLGAIVALMRAVRPTLTELDMKMAEYEVFAALQFSIKPSIMYRALELFLGHSERLAVSPADMPFIRSKALIILRIVYITRAQIYEQFERRYPRLDVVVLAEHMSDRQRRLCLAAAVVVCSFMFAEQPGRHQQLKMRLAHVAGLPLRQLTQMAEVMAHVVGDEATPRMSSMASGARLVDYHQYST